MLAKFARSECRRLRGAPALQTQHIAMHHWPARIRGSSSRTSHCGCATRASPGRTVRQEGRHQGKPGQLRRIRAASGAHSITSSQQCLHPVGRGSFTPGGRGWRGGNSLPAGTGLGPEDSGANPNLLWGAPRWSGGSRSPEWLGHTAPAAGEAQPGGSRRSTHRSACPAKRGTGALWRTRPSERCAV
eukprot:14593364-Alexandrium_andersonii.AAC.1